MTATPRPSAAVAGASGLTAAHVLGAPRQVTLHDADTHPGGPAHTHDVPSGDRTLRIDGGLFVPNERTPADLRRALRERGVRARPTKSLAGRRAGSG